MIQMTREELREMLTEVCEERARLDSEEHMGHHVWIQERIQAEKDRREMYKEITRVVIQWSIPVLLGSGWFWFKAHWKD